MPRKDPITGCMVMTNAEFWQAEASREGRNAGELQEEFYKRLNDETELQRAKYYDNEFTLGFIRSLAAGDLLAYRSDLRAGEKSEKPHSPVVVLEVEDVRIKDSFRSQELWVCGRAICKDQVERRFCATTFHYSGDFYEPPNSDEYLLWKEIGWKAGAIEFFKKMKRMIVPKVVRNVFKRNLWPKNRTGTFRGTTYYDWYGYTFVWKQYQEWEV